MRTTVIQLNANELESTWPALVTHCAENTPDLVVLPEFPFGPWLAATNEVDVAAWRESERLHTLWIDRLGELGVSSVVGSRPITDDGRRYNEAFVWSPGAVTPSHRKTYLPDEPGFWEATWYDRGPVEFIPDDTTAGRLGFQICTEMWFFGHARAYGLAGSSFVVTPRATEATTLEKWIAGGRVSAVSAGAYALSSNHSGSYPGVMMGGGAWVMSPDGDVLALTTDDEPFATVECDLTIAQEAKSTYPRYVITSSV